jgi:Tfp pilus assembly protein PilO
MVKKEKANELTYIAAVVGGALLVALLLSLLIAKPLYSSLKESNLELKVKKEVLTKLENNLENLKSLESRKEEIVAKNEKVLAALPTDKDVPRLFIQFERIANDAGLIIKSVAEGSESDTSATTPSVDVVTVKPLYYQVTGSASNYGAIKGALAKIEEGLRLVTVDRIDIQNEASGDQLNVTMIVKTYSRGQ